MDWAIRPGAGHRVRMCNPDKAAQDDMPARRVDLRQLVRIGSSGTPVTFCRRVRVLDVYRRVDNSSTDRKLPSGIAQVSQARGQAFRLACAQGRRKRNCAIGSPPERQAAPMTGKRGRAGTSSSTSRPSFHADQLDAPVARPAQMPSRRSVRAQDMAVSG
jgi:hypothetical protein